MKKTYLLICSLSACLYSQVTLATEDPNVTIMKQLFTKIAADVGVGNNDPTVGETFLVLANPGILVDPHLDLSNVDDQYKLARVVDRVMAPSWLYKPRNLKTLDVYKTILGSREVPLYSLNATQQVLLDKARGQIFSDINKRTYSEAFKTYQDKRKALASATKACETYRRNHPGEDVDADLADNLQRARDDYALVGNRNQMLAAYTTLLTYEGFDPNVWWGGLNEQFNNNVGNRNNTQVATYNFYPTYPNWTDTNTLWTRMALTQSSVERTTSSSHTSVGGGLSLDFGLWSVGGDYSHEENRSYYKMDVSGFNLEFEIMRVDIDRPWMEAQVFYSRAWRWLQTSPYFNQLISDGNDTKSGKTPQGVMPFMPVGLLLARNVKLSGNWSSDLQTFFSQRTSGGGSVGWGPFSFGGRSESDDQNSYTKGEAAGNTLTFRQPQILGFFVEVLPVCPNPDPKLNFPGDNFPSMLADFRLLDVCDDATLKAYKDPLLLKSESLLKLPKAKR